MSQDPDGMADIGGGPEPAPSLLATVTGIAALLISISMLLAGNGLQGTLVPIRGNLEAFAAGEIGLLGTGYFAGFTLGCLIGPSLLGRAGHIRLFMAMASTASVAALIHAVWLDPILWAVLRGLTGVCFAILYIVIESWLNEKSTNKTRGTVFSIYTVVNLAFMTVGQLLIATADPNSFVLFALASILISLAGVPLAFTKSTLTTPPSAVRIRLVKLYRNSPVGSIGCLSIGFANGALWTLAPVFAQNNGLDAAGIGLFMSAIVIGGAVLQWPMGALSDRIDRRRVIILATALCVGAEIALTLFGGAGYWTLLGLAGVFGACALPIYSLCIAHANDHANPADMVEVSSGLLLLFGLGAAAGPLLAGVLDQLLPFPALFAYMASVHVLLILFVLWRITRRARAAEDDRISFGESAIAAYTLSPLETQTTIEHSEMSQPADGTEITDSETGKAPPAEEKPGGPPPSA